MPPRSLPPRTRAVAILGLGATFLAVAAAKAWVCDDAYITFRTADNLLHGFGPRWNAAERVQAYTHPLWMLLVTATATLTREFYVTSMVLGLVLSAAALWILIRHLARSTAGACLAMLVLGVSRAATDYATSGLENPLAHLLLVLFLVAYWRPRRDVATVGLGLALAALAACNRLDALALLAPAVLVLGRELPAAKRWRILAAAFLPLVAWEAFALFYYGTPLPNSAIAKLAAGLPALELVRQGLAYLANSLRLDPVTLLATATGLVLASRQRQRRDLALAIGIALHLLYVVGVGGDFMSGRFLTPTLWMAAALVARARWHPRLAWATASLCIAIAAAAWGRDPARAAGDRPLAARSLDGYGIADERAFYAHITGWRFAPRRGAWPDPATAAMAARLRQDWLADPFVDVLRTTGLLAADDSLPGDAAARVSAGRARAVVARAAVGTLGFDVGPALHVLDLYALGDPLRARLPALRRDPLLQQFLPSLAGRAWRPGHFVRRIPAGYVATLCTGSNQLRDPDLASYWEDVACATRGSLWAPRRAGAIGRLLRGARDARLQRWASRDRETE